MDYNDEMEYRDMMSELTSLDMSELYCELPSEYKQVLEEYVQASSSLMSLTFRLAMMNAAKQLSGEDKFDDEIHNVSVELCNTLESCMTVLFKLKMMDKVEYTEKLFSIITKYSGYDSIDECITATMKKLEDSRKELGISDDQTDE